MVYDVFICVVPWSHLVALNMFLLVTMSLAFVKKTWSASFCNIGVEPESVETEMASGTAAFHSEDEEGWIPKNSLKPLSGYVWADLL